MKLALTNFSLKHPWIVIVAVVAVTLAFGSQFPKVKFEHATGYRQADNVATYSARFYEGRHVIGKIAGDGFFDEQWKLTP